MKLTFLERRANQQATEQGIERDGATLRVVERPVIPSWEPRVIPGGVGAAAGAVSAKAEITAKRFSNGKVAQDRYEAMLTASDGSPSALMAALVEAFAELPEFRQSGALDDRVILQISLIR